MTYIGYITGPRSEPPVGVRVVEPPPGTRQHQRGNLYAVVEVTGEHPDRAAIADRLLSEIQRGYYTAKGSQSQVMVEALQQAQQLLREVNAQSPHYPLQAGLLCTALLNDRLLMACSGAAFALVRASDKVHMFPSDPMATLGGYGQAPVEVYRQEVKPDDALFLGGGSWLRRVPVRTLASVVMFTNAENCNDAADELFAQGGNTPLPGLLVVVGGDDPPSGGYSSRSDLGNGPQSAQRRPRFSGLPTALGAPPPAGVPPVAPAQGQARPSTRRTTGVPAPSRPQPHAALPDNAAPSIPVETPSEAAAPAPPTQNLPREPVEALEPIFPESAVDAGLEQARDERPRWPAALAGAASAGMRQVRGFFARMLPEVRTPPEEEVEPFPARFAETPAAEAATMMGEPLLAVEEPLSAVESAPSGLEQRFVETPGIEPPQASETEAEYVEEIPAAPTPVLDMSPFATPERATGARKRVFLLAALALLILVPAVVLAMTLVPGANSRAEAERLTERAEMALLGGQSALDAGDKVTARERFTEAQDYLAQAIELDGLNEHRSRLVATIESELQEVLQIVPLYGLTDPMLTFPAEARPQRVLVMNDAIYVLDAGRQAVVRYRFNPANREVLEPEGQIVLRQGDVVDGAVAGTLTDMAWLPLIPSVEDRPSLLIIDRNNNVFRFDERVVGVSLMDIAGRGSWGSIGQIQTYGQRIYIADDALGAIYRINPADLSTPAENWFAGPTQPDLSGLVAMEIDGDIWVLLRDGVIVRYRGGEQEPFSPENSIGLAEDPVDMFVTSQATANIYLVDADQDRILVYDKGGAYLSQLRAPEDELLAGLSGLYIDEVTGTMYLLTQTSLFAHSLIQ
jgi:hypothetical protein